MPREAEAVAYRTKPSRYDSRAKEARPSRATSGVAKEAYYTYTGLVTGEIKKKERNFSELLNSVIDQTSTKGFR